MRLPDHDFAVGSRHLLCPSVVAVHRVKENNSIGYTGETYVAVRSQKHNNSTAFSHHEDLLRVVELFPEAFKTASFCQLQIGERTFRAFSPGMF